LNGDSLEASVAESLIGLPSELLYARFFGRSVHSPGDLFCSSVICRITIQNTPASRTGGIRGSLPQFVQNHVDIPALSERVAEPSQSLPQLCGTLAGLRASGQIDQRLQATHRDPQIVNYASTAGP
jgi:hypothetical protein